MDDCSGWLYRQPTKIEQTTEPMMDREVALMEEIRTNQAKTDANL
jgi:hypothetical protein